MKNGFIKVAAASNKVNVADVDFNIKNAVEIAFSANKENAKVLVLPELCVTGSTAGDLFASAVLCKDAEKALLYYAKETASLDMISVIGLPLANMGKLYNCAAVIKGGKVLGIVPKTYIPCYGDFDETRYFAAAPAENTFVSINGEKISFGAKLLFCCKNMEELVLAAGLGDDMHAVNPVDIRHAQNGATLIANLSARNDTVGGDDYTQNLVKMHSAQLLCSYIYANAGEGESTTDLVFAGGTLIAENGSILTGFEKYNSNISCAVTDLQKICGERARINTFDLKDDGYKKIYFELSEEETELLYVDDAPFIPKDKDEREKRNEQILKAQSEGLKKRLLHTNTKKAVIGISGGLDSALALLVAARAFDSANIPRENILAITMPCFGTSKRTYENAMALCSCIGVSLREINIEKAVLKHFEDIGQSKDSFDVTYENSQARERTQVLFDLANKEKGMVIGTGDLSELALGWATYGGDHLSSYGVNASIAKTLVRELVKYEAENSGDELKMVLTDICDTPVSPELLPLADGEIAQKTEQLVGPYKLTDFFIYYLVRYGFSPEKIYKMAKYAFKDEFDGATIKKWLTVFLKRFFSQQFKRNCLPDGPKVGSVSLSPRGAWKMPSDVSAKIWIENSEVTE